MFIAQDALVQSFQFDLLFRAQLNARAGFRVEQMVVENATVHRFLGQRGNVLFLAIRRQEAFVDASVKVELEIRRSARAAEQAIGVIDRGVIVVECAPCGRHGNARGGRQADARADEMIEHQIAIDRDRAVAFVHDDEIVEIARNLVVKQFERVDHHRVDILVLVRAPTRRGDPVAVVGRREQPEPFIDRLPCQRAPIHHEQDAPGQRMIEQRPGEGDHGSRLAQAGGHVHQHLHLAVAVMIEQRADAIQLVGARFACRRVESASQGCVDADFLLLSFQPVLLDLELHIRQGHEAIDHAEIRRIHAAPGEVEKQHFQSARAIGRAGIEETGFQQTAVFESQLGQRLARIVQLVLNHRQREALQILQHEIRLDRLAAGIVLLLVLGQRVAGLIEQCVTQPPVQPFQGVVNLEVHR